MGKACVAYHGLKLGMPASLGGARMGIDRASLCPDKSHSAQSCLDESRLGSDRARYLGNLLGCEFFHACIACLLPSFKKFEIHSQLPRR